jgi:hypothetical protein
MCDKNELAGFDRRLVFYDAVFGNAEAKESCTQGNTANPVALTPTSSRWFERLLSDLRFELWIRNAVCEITPDGYLDLSVNSNLLGNILDHGGV